MNENYDQRIDALTDADYRKRPAIRFTYKNHEGTTDERHAVPLEIHYGSNEWHKEPQYFLRAYDLDRKAIRDFALANILTGMTPYLSYSSPPKPEADRASRPDQSDKESLLRVYCEHEAEVNAIWMELGEEAVMKDAVEEYLRRKGGVVEKT